ncbi:MAG: peptidase M3, partial [Bacteroidales bacterium]|nr:peptidase M3 [Bacteroidales bacterium]
MNIKILPLLIVVTMLASCTKTEKEENPFFTEYNTPYGVAPFDKIKTEHYLPAFNKGIEEQKAEIDKIVNSKESPTFENTIVAMEYTGALLQKTSSVFGNLLSADTNDEMQEIAKEVYPRLSKHQDEIYLNNELFVRVKAVYDQKETLELDSESLMLLEEVYKDFLRSGANLPAEKKEKLKKINEELSLLSLQFGENLLAETNNF